MVLARDLVIGPIGVVEVGGGVCWAASVFLWHHLVVEGALPSFLELALAMSLVCLDGCTCSMALCLWRRLEVDVAWPWFLVALWWRRLDDEM